MDRCRFLRAYLSPDTTISEFTQIVYPNGILNNGSYGVEKSYGKFALRARATATLMRGMCILPVSSTTLTMVTVSRIPTETVFYALRARDTPSTLGELPLSVLSTVPTASMSTTIPTAIILIHIRVYFLASITIL